MYIVQASMPNTVEKATKSVEIGLSINMGLSDYSLNDNYLRKTKGMIRQVSILFSF